MVRQAVKKSSFIAAIGYDETKQVLDVEFKGGTVYQYAKVPKEHFEEMLKAKSAGTYFYKHIRGKYDHTKLEEEGKE